MTFNEKLIRLRKLNSLTQDEFAKKVGVSRQAVYKWESGQSYPEVPTLLQIKELFSVSIDDLLDESYEIALPEKPRRRAKSMPQKTEAEDTSTDVGVGVRVTDEKEKSGIKFRGQEQTEQQSVIEETKNEEVSVSEQRNTTVGEEKKSEEEEVKREEISATSEKREENTKKKGFFERLFGRK